MNAKKIYGAIAGVFAIVYTYNLYWFVKNIIEYGSIGISFEFFIRYLPAFAGITGVIIFISSQFRRSNLLRIMMCVELLSFPFMAFWYVQFFTKTYGPYDQPAQLNWTFYVGVLINLSMLIASITGLRMLSLNKTAKLTYIDYGNERSAQFSPANAGLRFANRMVDLVVIFFVLFTNIDSFRFLLNVNIETEAIFIFEIPFFIFYYIILEGIFNTTAGKCATNTTIVNEIGERPNFGQIIGRTFCRLIPFEPFSFFKAGARGWHDSLPNTYVVESINKEDAAMNEIVFDAEMQNT
jgi:hypothetical protein